MRKSFIGHMIAKARNTLSALACDTRGVSAVEFALILPVMITMYIGAVEFSHALTVDRRVTAVASAASDLAAQTEEVSSNSVQDIFTAATSIMTPYSVAPISIVLTSVVADEDNTTTVDWSCAQNGAPHSTGSSFTLPDGLTQPFSSVIVAEVSYDYQPPIGRYMVGGINMTETFYLRPRRSLTVEWQGGAC
jgi:Flp pilus assembly protein TadG